jgi:hypothetical protein
MSGLGPNQVKKVLAIVGAGAAALAAVEHRKQNQMPKEQQKTQPSKKAAVEKEAGIRMPWLP